MDIFAPYVSPVQLYDKSVDQRLSLQESILIKEDGVACIDDFGLMTLAGGVAANLDELLRWWPPELIRMSRQTKGPDDAEPTVDKQTDIYSFGEQRELVLLGFDRLNTCCRYLHVWCVAVPLLLI